MIAILVHHADAVTPAVDTRRPLSSAGHAEAEDIALQAKALGAAPAEIWHSGKLRARQTGEAFLRACSPFAAFRMMRGLAPDDDPALMRAALDAEACDVMVVGHMPNIARLAAGLAGTDVEFPLHGAVCFERATSGAWMERWRVMPGGAPGQ